MSFRFVSLITLALLHATVQAASPTPSVNVTFMEPERFIDAGDGAGERRENLAELERQLQRLGSQSLAPGQRLRLEIRQVDLAGQVLPFVGGRVQPTRVLNGGADWPRIDLHWTLVNAEGQVERSGDAAIEDPTYLQRRLTGASTARLPYEQRMLARWFKQTFGDGR